MPPCSLWLRIGSPGRDGRRLWLPLFLVWLLGLPLVLVALVLALAADVVLYVAGRPYHYYTLLLVGCLGLVARTRGMVVRVNDGDSIVDVAIQ